MMSRRVQENLIVLLLLAMFVAVIVASMDYSFRARMVPLPMAVLGCILAVIQLVWQNLRPVDELQLDMFEFITGRTANEEPAAVQAVIEQQPGPSPDAPKRTAAREFMAAGVVALLLALFFLVGPVPATFVFTTGYLLLTGKHGFARSVLYSAVLTLILAVMFGYILQVQLDRSLLLPPLAPMIGF